MKEYRYLFDKNIEINYTQNDTSINYKDNTNTNITSINPSIKNHKNLNYFFPSYNTRQFKEEKSSSLINKFLNKKESSKVNSKYSTCYNYYQKKNYSKYLNYNLGFNGKKENTNLNQKNITFDDYGEYNKLNTKELIEITRKRKEIIEQKKSKEEEKKKSLENNLERLNIILNDNLDNYLDKNKKYCDEGVQTSLININQLDNKKEDQISTIIFTDKSALINQEITFLSIKLNNNEEINNYNNNEISKEYKNTDNNDFVNIECGNKETINEIEKKDVKEKNKNINNNKGKKEENSEKKDNNLKEDLEFTIINNSQTSPNEDNEENNYMTNGPETFQIELNDQKKEDKNNNNNNDEDNNFIISNNNTKKPPKFFNDSLEDTKEINIKNDKNKSNTLTNSDENELTEIEEYDQNMVFLQNQSKTMSSHFDKINNKNSIEKDENKNSKNNNNILIEDISNNKSIEKVSFENKDSLNDSSSSLSNKENDEQNNDIQIKRRNNNSFQKNKVNLKLRNINESNCLKSKLYIKNSLTNNDRYQNKEEKNKNYNLLKLKASDLKSNSQKKLIFMQPIQNLDSISKDYIYKPNIKNKIQNIKVFSKKKLNITTNENSKINISGIPICPHPNKDNKKNIKENSIINNDNNITKNLNLKNNININNNKKNYLITPRCLKKKRQLNNYAEYYKLKISMSKDITNININDNNINNNEYNYNKNFRSLGHQKSYEKWKNKK